MSVSDIVVGKVYLVGLEYPTELNDDSPLTRFQMHIGVVLRWDPHSRIAVIFLGTTRPQVPHRYIPWAGTNRMDFQPREVLELTPSGAFADRPGFFMNFTHALRVRVVEQDALSTSAQNFLKASPLRHGEPLDIMFDSDQLEKLRRLHEAYWSGVRYNRDGSDHGGDNGHDGDEDGGGEIPEALSLKFSRL